MSSFDIIYANQQIDLITNKSAIMVDLYKQLVQQLNPSDESISELAEMYYLVTDSIQDYFEYLQKMNVPFEESYLTSWLKKDNCPDYFNNIEDLINKS